MGPEAREAMGVGEGLIRINVGLEDPADLIEDSVDKVKWSDSKTSSTFSDCLFRAKLQNFI